MILGSPLKEDEIQAGKQVIFYDKESEGNYLNDSIMEIIGKGPFSSEWKQIRVECRIIKSNDKMRQPGYIIQPIISLVFNMKPHVYSPVFMTGRYRTVGD